MAKLERKMEITLPLPEQKFRRFADLWSGLKCGHTMARTSAVERPRLSRKRTDQLAMGRGDDVATPQYQAL
jgi:hypothetical protein